MNMKKTILILILILSLLAEGCSKQIKLDENDRKLLSYNFKITDLENVDETLSKQNYSYTTDVDKKYIAVITYQSENAIMHQYLIDKDGTVNLTIPNDSLFIISLPANRTIAYTWNIKNNINNGIVKFENRSWVHMPMPNSDIGKIGVNYDRQNFYFKPLKSGSEKLVMRYEHQTELRDEFFEVTFNASI